MTEAAQKQLSGLATREQGRINNRLNALCRGLDEGQTAGDVRKLQGEDDAWRLRSGDYRVLFGKDEDSRLVVAFKVGHRRDVYR